MSPSIARRDSTSNPDMTTSSHMKPAKWSFGILNDKETDEVPGSVLLLSKVNKRNEPLGLQYAPGRRSNSSLPDPFPRSDRSRSRTPTRHSAVDVKKMSKDGAIVLEPQPEDTKNDPLNWAMWRRDAALLSLGFYCMVGGGMTPILAAGFNNVAATYNVTTAQVALTTGLYMLGLGIGSVIMSPTAILFGKRPVYLSTAILFIVSCVWCALSPNYASLVVARIFQGIAVSPVECLPSASIAEIFFLHERAYRLGIYTLLLLGGKNLVPLVSAVIIQALDWQWVFWVVAMVVALGALLLFLFVPETFWDRTPRPRHVTRPHKPRTPSQRSLVTHLFQRHRSDIDASKSKNPPIDAIEPTTSRTKKHEHAHVAFREPSPDHSISDEKQSTEDAPVTQKPKPMRLSLPVAAPGFNEPPLLWRSPTAWDVAPAQAEDEDNHKTTPELRNLNSPYYEQYTQENDYFSAQPQSPPPKVSEQAAEAQDSPVSTRPTSVIVGSAATTGVIPSPEEETPPAVVPIKASTHSDVEKDVEHPPVVLDGTVDGSAPALPYTDFYRTAPAKSYRQSLTVYHGRLSHDSWFRVALRPFILFAYPAVLWSATIYALSVGWLIVLSESVSDIYKSRNTYNFNALQTGLVYLSPFIGGILGTAVAGKVSDILVRFMARRNGGVYEPEFRLIMALPVALSTTIGLMGFGWSAQERDAWIVPTVFFGVISFGCSLGSTTAITFCVDSYRQYAGEALVTLNFSKNVLHGLVFSLFFTHWLESSGSREVFLAIGGIQMGCCLFTIPLYIYGKRLRMWTVRRNLMERF